MDKNESDFRMLLFESKIRTYLGYSNTLEDIYSFLDRSCSTEFVPVRKRLESWFSHYPQHEQKELKSRFQSSNHFDDAFFELYLHEMYYQEGYQIDIHPALVHTTKRPDFFISKGEERFYLEARLVRDESDEERQERARKDKLVDELNKLEAFPYWINVESLELITKQSFSLYPLRNAIEKAAEEIDYFQCLGKVASISFAYQDDNFEIELSFDAQLYSELGDENRPVGIRGYYGAKWVDNAASLRKAVLNNAKRYGKLDAPLVIALNSLTPHLLNIYDIEKLIGKNWQHVIAENGQTAKGYFISSEGVFSGRTKDKLKHVSALFISSVSPHHNGAETRYWCKNPNYMINS